MQKDRHLHFAVMGFQQPEVEVKMIGAQFLGLIHLDHLRFDHLILPIPKSDSGDSRLRWSPPAVPFTAAVGCVDL